MAGGFEGFQCPVPNSPGDSVTLAHGEGGRLLRKLLCERILPRFGPASSLFADAAVLQLNQSQLAFSTDSFVVSPLFFPGGDIGTLAVFGTSNDLAVAGARPRWISLSLMIEEGLPLATLDRVLDSVAAAAIQAQVSIVAGDTKVVPRGAVDKLFINTAGIGELSGPTPPGPTSLVAGDELLVSGPIASHGIAVLAAREQLRFDPPPQSDCAPLAPAVEALRRAAVPVKTMRDATRGGVAAVLHEWSAAADCTMAIDESSVPVRPEVRAIGELLGLDPLHVANEGAMVVAVPSGCGEAALAALRSVDISKNAALIGHVAPAGISPVVVRRSLGRYQPLDEPAGAPLPRIC